MDIKQLRYFVAVARNKNLSGAANEVYISQQGLSMAISRLEDELSCRLLVRTPEGMSMTEEGEYLFSRAEKLLFMFDELESHFIVPDRQSSIVRVALAFGALPEFFAEALADFRKKYPEYRVELEELNDMDCDRAVELGKADIGFGISPLNEQKFICSHIYSSPYCLIVNVAHPFAHKKTISIKELYNVPVMMMNSRSKTTPIFQGCSQANNVPLTVHYLAGEVIAIHRLVSANMGVGISVLSVAESLAHPNVVAIPFEEPELVWEICMFRRRDSTLSLGAERLRRHVLEGNGKR